MPIGRKVANLIENLFTKVYHVDGLNITLKHVAKEKGVIDILTDRAIIQVRNKDLTSVPLSRLIFAKDGIEELLRREVKQHA